MSLYAVRDLSVAIEGRRLVEGLSFTVEPGQCVALVGASGSGKTLGCMTPFGLSPGRAAGSAVLDGKELVGAPEKCLRRLRSHKAGFVFQQPLTALTPHLTVGRQLTEAAMQAGSPRPGRRALVAMLERVGLDRAEERLDQFPHRLSGGERQRVMIAAAIAHGPSLLIADEPVSALDAVLRSEIMALLRHLRREQGLGLLLVSHDLASIEQHADHLVVMEAGRVVEAGPAPTVIATPREDYTRRLIEATARLSDPAPDLPMPGETALEVTGLSVRFARPGWRRGWMSAVDGADLSVRRGEALALVGASGSGKSTLARAIGGLSPLDKGYLVWDGRPLPPAHRRSRKERRIMQPVFQDPAASLDPHWRVGRIVAEPLLYLEPGLSAGERASRAVAALEKVGLPPELAGRDPRSLSGGQAQRVAIARAIIADPDMLLLDEATSALDVMAASGIIALLAQLQREKGLSLLFVTHDLALARKLCHRAAVMEAGRIVETGPVEELLRRPQAEATRRLVAAC